MDSECTELLGCFSPADAMHSKYPLEPIRIHATRPVIDQHSYRLGLILITEIGESKARMEMIKSQYLTNLHDISTDIECMHMDPEFWNQQHTLDNNFHHLNSYMIDIVQSTLGRCNANGNVRRAGCSGIRLES
jgi:hypothetical protein